MQFVFKNRRWARLLVFSLLLGLFACGNHGIRGIAGTTATPVTEPGTPPTDVDSRPQVTSGWLDQYSIAVEDTVSGKYPELLDLGASRMTTVCPKWGGLTASARENFWSAMLWSIAGAESSRVRTTVFRETTLSIDAVTGQQIRSEGLLQLSYVDVPNYAYKGGDVSWAYDKVMALADYASGAKLGNPARTILNAYANLNLGLWIMYRRLIKAGSTESFEAALGHYWATMKTGGSGFAKVLAGLKTRIPNCF